MDPLRSIGSIPPATPEIAIAATTAARTAPEGARTSPETATDSTTLTALFEFSADRREVRIRIVDGSGALVRQIPPGTVAEMMSAIARYPRPR
jgi:hypothetical protein